jgi:hypothetical protein
MPKKLSDIILPNADWTVRKIDFNSPEIQQSIKECLEAQEECERRKYIDPEKLRIVINPYR